jgi:hypothetical protein
MFETSLLFCGWFCPAKKGADSLSRKKRGKEGCPASEHWEKGDGFQHEGGTFCFHLKHITSFLKWETLISCPPGAVLQGASAGKRSHRGMSRADALCFGSVTLSAVSHCFIDLKVH